MPVYENERGTYIFNSKDLCMIEHIPELMESGIDSFKIEGAIFAANIYEKLGFEVVPNGSERRTLQRSNASSYLSVNPESPNGSSSKRFVPIT